MAQGEMFLSSAYQRINPLLKAFEDQGVAPEHYFWKTENTNDSLTDGLLAQWKAVAKSRRPADATTVEAWDAEDMKTTYGQIQGIARSWDKYKVPTIPDGYVVRGDSVAVYKSFPELYRRATMATGKRS